VQPFNPARRNAQHVADLDAHPMVGCDHVRLDDDHHVLFEGEAVARAARCATGAQERGVDAAHRAVDEVVVDRQAGVVDLLGDVQNRLARRPRPDRVADFVVNGQRQFVKA